MSLINLQLTRWLQHVRATWLVRWAAKSLVTRLQDIATVNRTSCHPTAANAETASIGFRHLTFPAKYADKRTAFYNNNNNNNNNNVRLLNCWHTAQLTILTSTTQGGTQQPPRRAGLCTEGYTNVYRISSNTIQYKRSYSAQSCTTAYGLCITKCQWAFKN